MKNKVLLLASLLSANLFVYADDSFKLGYVDVNKIFATAKPAVALQGVLKAKFAPEQQELQKMNTNLLSEQAPIEAIIKKAPSPDKLSASDRSKLQKLEIQYQKDQMAFQQKYTLFQQQLQKNQDYASALILGKTNTFLKNISEKGGYDLVLTSNQLVYAKPKYDLTDQVIAQLNTLNSDDIVKQFQEVDKGPLDNSTLQKLAAPSITASSPK